MLNTLTTIGPHGGASFDRTDGTHIYHNGRTGIEWNPHRHLTDNVSISYEMRRTQTYVPTPMQEPFMATRADSPPEDPPAVRFVLWGFN